MEFFDKKRVWREVLESIRVSVSQANFSTWFSQTHLSTLKKNGGRYIAEVGCRSGFVKNTIESRYFGLIQDSLSKTLESPCDLLFLVKQDPDAPYPTLNEPLFESSKKDVDLTEILARAGIRPFFTFENFAVSS